MARSGSHNFTLTRDNLITHALRKANIISDKEVASSGMLNYASNELNLMIKAWQAEDLPLWNRVRGHLFTAYQTNSYLLGPTGTHATKSYVSTQLNGALAASATAVTVDSTTGMTATDKIGIKLTDGTKHWDIIASIDSSTTLTLTTGVASAASDDAYVTSYTSLIPRPLRILQMTYEDLSTGSEVPITMIGYDEYFRFPNKNSNGAPSNFYYDKLLDDGKLYLYPRPNNVNYVIHFTYHESIEDFDSATDEADFPTEWLDALILNLAVRLGKHYGKYVEMKELQPDAEIAKMNAKWFNSDEADLKIKVK